eukprot:Skav201133  [mRNA]  locus=scaffold2860:71061:74234:+ [translate_table: standard]
MIARSPSLESSGSQSKWSDRKSPDGIRVARLRGSADAAKPELGPLEVDLEETSPPKLPRQGELGTWDLGGGTSCDEVEVQPKGALFLGMGHDALHLSALKESLLGAEWSTEVEMAFRAPPGQRPWSSRILSLGKAAVGFKNGPERALASDGFVEHMDKAAGAAEPLRLEGMPSEEFFLARAALYKRCAIV